MLTPLFNKYSNKLKDIKTQHHGDIWHYTSSQGLKGIVENDNIWFSDRRFLNDQSECSYVYQLIKELLNDGFFMDFEDVFIDWIHFLTQEFTNTDIEHQKQDTVLIPCYVASFSKENDSLSLWNYYTKSQQHAGYALNFNTEELLKNIKSQTENLNYSYTNGIVIYSKEEQFALLKDLLKEYHQIFVKYKNAQKNFQIEIFFFEIINLLDIYNLFFKPSSYEVEQEYRFVIADTNTINNNITNLKFRIFNDIFIPYIELFNIRKLIKEIKISPSQNQKLLENSISIFKNNYKLHNIEFSKSDIPMRY